MLTVQPVAVLSDNYVWIITADEGRAAAVVDPGDAAPVADYLEHRSLDVGAYLITHHHGDHIGGLAALRARWPAPVYGPLNETKPIPGIDHTLAGGDRFTLDFAELEVDVIDVPGHTLGHIAFHLKDALFAGDTLFRGGCGRVFEGSFAQMRASLARLRDLPPATHVYGGHEYTQKNLAFAQQVEPDNDTIAAAVREVDALRRAGEPSLPTRLDAEIATNPFLRWDQSAIVAAAEHRAGESLADADAVFEVIRRWKDAA